VGGSRVMAAVEGGAGGFGGCSGVRALGCILLALSGLALVFVPALEDYWAVRLTSLALFLVSLASPLYLVGRRVAVAWLLVSAVALALAFAAPHLWPAVVALGFLGSALLAVESVPAGLVSLGVTASLAVVAGPEEYKWVVLAAYSVLPALAASMASRRLHPLIAAGAAVLVVILAGRPEAVAAAMLPVLAFLASTGVMEKSMCPFRSDARLVMFGSLLAVGGLLSALDEESLAAKGLWTAGLLLLVVGLLVPSRAFQAAQASARRLQAS